MISIMIIVTFFGVIILNVVSFVVLLTSIVYYDHLSSYDRPP